MVAGARANGVDVWSFVARGEGHSFRKRRNRDGFYRVMAEFFERYLVEGRAVLTREGDIEPGNGADDDGSPSVDAPGPETNPEAVPEAD